MKLSEAVKIATCERCGQIVRLVRWGLHFKWVNAEDAWKCMPTGEFPVRSHHPVQS